MPDRSEVEVCVIYLYVLGFLRAATARPLIQATNHSLPNFSVFISANFLILNKHCGTAMKKALISCNS